MQFYQMTDNSLPDYESQFPVNDIDRDVVTTMNRGGRDINYYDYDISNRKLVSGNSDSKIILPTQPDYGLPEKRTENSSNDEQTDRDFLLGNSNTSLTERIDTVNNGRLSDIQLVDSNLPKDGDIVINKNNKETSIKGIIEGTAVSDLFFSDMNIDVLQKSIRYEVNKKTGEIISNQSEKSLYIVMRSIMLQYANLRVSTKELVEEIRGLNKRVLEYCVNNVSSNVQQYVNYIKDLEKLAIPLDRPAFTSNKNYTYDISNLVK